MNSLIESIHTSGYKAVLVISGGGTGAVHSLLACPGASRFALDVQIPYSPAAMEAFLGERPHSACSEETAKQLMLRAFERGLTFEQTPLLSISCTAALQTNRIRKGTDRAFVGLKTAEAETLFRLDFSDGNRFEQEDALSRSLLMLIANAVGVEPSISLPEGVACSRL